MPVDILMPALSPTMEKGNLAKWLKKEGDVIKSGDILAEIETDKATMEVEAVDEGVLAKIVVPDGSADVPGQRGDRRDRAGGGGRFSRGAAAKLPAAARRELRPRAPLWNSPPRRSRTALRGERPGSTPGARDAKAREPNRSRPHPATASSPRRSRAASPNRRGSTSPASRDRGRTGASSSATSRPRSRPGRAQSAEVPSRRACTGGPAMPVTPPTPEPKAAPDRASDAAVKGFSAGTFEEVPHDGMRKTIARRLAEAKQASRTSISRVDCETRRADGAARADQRRGAARKDGKPAYKVSVNDFVIKGLALALQRVPDANATWTESAMLKHRHSDIGVAVSIPGGLITPVVRGAETKTLSAISNEMKDFAARGKARKLKPEEYQGGTSAVSNLGMFGIKHFSAVINPPHATILAVGAGREARGRQGRRAGGRHRDERDAVDRPPRVDGALGAQLISAFKDLIEAPMGMLV